MEDFDLANHDDLPKLKDFAAAQSLFTDFKLGILNNAAEADAGELEKILQLATDAKTLTLAISANAPLTKLKVLRGSGVIKEDFKTLTKPALAGLIQKEAAKRGLKLSPKAVAALAENYSGDSWAAITELDKLSLGGAPEPFLEEQNFFELIGRLQKSGSPLARLAALEKLLNRHESAMIFNFIANRANPALKTKMADYDVAIKSGKMDYEEALTELAI